MAVQLSANGIGHFNEVTLHWAGLVQRWVTVLLYTILVFNHSPRQTQPCHPFMRRHNEYWQC